LSSVSENSAFFTITYNRCKKALYNYILKMTGERMISDDILQNTFLKFYDNLDKIRNRDSAVIWLYKTARNEVYNQFRKMKTRAEKDSPECFEEFILTGQSDPEAELEKKELKEIIRLALNELNPEGREIFILKEYSGLSYREIGAALGIAEELVKSRLFRIRQKMIEKISKHIRG